MREKQRPDNYLIDSQECPPISRELLAHLDKMFDDKEATPTSATLQQELVFQAGINCVKKYLAIKNREQETKLLSKG